MLYIFDGLELLSNDFLVSADQFLSIQRREKIMSLKKTVSKVQSAVAYLLLRFALRTGHGINEAVEFSFTATGKPLLKDYGYIHFSLSHCKSAVACALSDADIGVDIQEIRPVTDKLLRRVLTEEEYCDYVSLKQNELKYFCKLWTIKEAYLKKTGQGIGNILSSINANEIQDITVLSDKNYFCCVTKENEVIRKVSCDELFK